MASAESVSKEIHLHPFIRGKGFIIPIIRNSARPNKLHKQILVKNHFDDKPIIYKGHVSKNTVLNIYPPTITIIIAINQHSAHGPSTDFWQYANLNTSVEFPSILMRHIACKLYKMKNWRVRTKFTKFKQHQTSTNLQYSVCDFISRFRRMSKKKKFAFLIVRASELSIEPLHKFLVAPQYRGGFWQDLMIRIHSHRHCRSKPSCKVLIFGS